MFKQVALTADQETKWGRCRTALLWHAPAFSHILYNMLQNGGGKDMAIFVDKDAGIPYAATDGFNLIINADTFFDWTLNEQIFVVCHEIMHCVFNHCAIGMQLQQRGKVTYPDGTEVEYDHGQMNQAMDYVINAIISDSKIGTMPKIGCLDPAIATSADNAMDTYRKIYQPGNPGKEGFDKHLKPGASTGMGPAQAVQQRNPSAWAQAVKDGADAARAMGRLPANLDRVLTEILEPKVDWASQIVALFARKVGSGTYDWRRPDRRLITRDVYAPGRSGFGAGDVVVAVDTSGSIGAKEIAMFFAEMSGILEDVKPKRMFVMWCDAVVHRVDELEDGGDLVALRAKKAPGGGGTSFVPVFDEIVKLGIEPEALVYLTDGMGTFPKQAPRYPVIWGNIYPAAKYPFGDVVDVPKQAA